MSMGYAYQVVSSERQKWIWMMWVCVGTHFQLFVAGRKILLIGNNPAISVVLWAGIMPAKGNERDQLIDISIRQMYDGML